MYMIEIKTTRYINTDDVEKLTGKHWGDFEFAQMAENDAYQVLCCSDGDLEELYEDLEWETGKEGMNPEDFEDEEEYEWRRRRCRAVRLKNQIELVEILRKDYGIRDSILIWISW
jgi:hypothetical protein